MFCTQCGVQIQEQDKYCSQCGRATAPGSGPAGFAGREPRRLRRSLRDKKIGGVCAGLAEYLDVDVVLARLLVVVGTIVSGGLGFLAYIAAWIIIPLEKGAEAYHATHSASAPAAGR